MMRRFWLFFPWYVRQRDMARLARDQPIANSAEVFAAGFGPTLDPKGFPVVELRLSLEDFGNDCFVFEGRTFVSERLRLAMNLDPASVQYFDVDATRSAPKPRSMNYQVMNVPAIEKASDLDKSNYLQFPPLSPGLGPAYTAQAIHIRDDLQTRHELFVDTVFYCWVCTDALAVRVLQAGCTGVRFIDPMHMIGNYTRHRTLRGVEGHVWDEKRDRLATVIIEPIAEG